MRRSLTALALLAALVVPLTVSGPADAAAVNWGRACSTTKSHPLSTSCTVTPPVWTHTLQYRDAAGKLHTIHAPATARRYVVKHVRKCRIVRHHSALNRACYGRDELLGGRTFTYQTGLTVRLSAIR